MEEILLLNVKIYKYSWLGYCHPHLNSLHTLHCGRGTLGGIHFRDSDTHREKGGKFLRMKIGYHIKTSQKGSLLFLHDV